MKLGISYIVFDGEELLEFAIKSIRKEVDHISVVYQTTSYFGNESGSCLERLLIELKKQGLVDETIHYEQDKSVHHKQNELRIRNIGLDASIRAGCSHHVSCDVDEFYKPEQFNFAKKFMYENDFDFSTVPMLYYYKKPTFLVWPPQDLHVSFIHPVGNRYCISPKGFPLLMETTRQLKNFDKIYKFNREEIEMHHMSYVRKDIKKKFKNSDNARFYQVEKFIDRLEKHEVGDKVFLLPDYINRRTKLVENAFNINLEG